MVLTTKIAVATSFVLLLSCQPGCEVFTQPGPSRSIAFLPSAQQQTGKVQTAAALNSAANTRIEQASWTSPGLTAGRAILGQPQDLPPVAAEELTVDAVVQEVLTRNPTVAQMVAAWQAASARYPQVTSFDDPSLDFTVAPASIGSNNVDFGGRIGISQKFPLGGKLGLRGQVAAAEASAAGNDVNNVRLQLAESAKTAFYDYYLVNRAQAVNEENLNLLKEARQSAENRVTTGKASQQEVIQIDVEIGKQGERVLTLERMRQVAVARINTLMHRPPDSPLLTPPSKLSVPVGLPDVEVLRTRAVDLRPDLRALSDRIAAEENSLALARSEYCPDLMVGAAYDSIMGNGPTRDLAPQLNVGINIPLRLGKRDAAVSEATAKIMQRRAELARMVDQVTFQVHEAYAQVAEAEKIVHLYEKKILQDAESNIKAARNAYTAGQIPLLSLLEAQRNLVDLRDRYYEKVANYFQRRATLERAVGEPFAPTADPAPPTLPTGAKR
jgi:outer membrane protein, heavy metal efflux system